MSEKIPSAYHNFQTFRTSEALREEVLKIPGITGIEPPIIARNPESHYTPSEYRERLKVLQESFKDDKRSQKTFEWIETTIQYLEFPFRYIDNFSTDEPSDHLKRKEWEWGFRQEGISDDVQIEYGKVQISKNTGISSFLGLLTFSPPGLQKLLESEKEAIAKIDRDVFSDGSREGDKNNIIESPYMHMSLEKKRDVVQSLVEIAHVMIEKSISFYEQQVTQ